MNITDFLLARIAEDEAVAQRARADLMDDEQDDGLRTGGDLHPSHERFLARVTPARVLAECEAKRQIVQLADWFDNYGGSISTALADRPSRLVLRSLAAVYADHPDYDPGWRVGGV